MRHICYVTGTRADFGLMRSTLDKIEQVSQLQLSVAITGMHLDSKFGNTKQEVISSGFNTYIVGNSEDDGSRLSMANAVGEQVRGFSQLFASLQPSIILLLGDRGEMLAAAIAALYLNIPVAHIHGGELSGTVDESIRHAISKLSHFHFVATEKSRDRLVRMGELASNVMVTGAPGLDDILNMELPGKSELFDFLTIKNSSRLLAVVFHPVVQDAELAGIQMEQVLAALPTNEQVVILMPNADAGGQLIRDKINEYSSSMDNVKVVTHLPRNLYLSLLAHCDVLIGNSSSGIIEAASFSTWVINIGERQANRDRNANTIDLNVDSKEINDAINQLLFKPEPISRNIYGDGKAGKRIAQLLWEINIDDNTTRKCNTY
ncbi:UDP-N-acetylglucosamine 2-epimerase [Photobacterium sagamiensis]|uniref:UDP-N-acetylglucosamine 2-epimerase n=1 Tax=Photobacterium sagamiensis TaxID=2910241 RepID=UPI003D0D04B8